MPPTILWSAHYRNAITSSIALNHACRGSIQNPVEHANNVNGTYPTASVSGFASPIPVKPAILACKIFYSRPASLFHRNNMGGGFVYFTASAQLWLRSVLTQVVRPLLVSPAQLGSVMEAFIFLLQVTASRLGTAESPISTSFKVPRTFPGFACRIDFQW